MKLNSKIFVAGHNGMVGKSIIKYLSNKGYSNLFTVSRKELDLCNFKKVQKYFDKNKPEYVIHAAGKVGGIKANSQYKADFMFINMVLAQNLIHNSSVYKVKKFLNLGSSCIYPRDAQQPIKETSFMQGQLEETNEGYSLAKISAIKLGNFYREQYGLNFISLMPPNLYGPNDSFDLEVCHVLSALIKRFYDAKKNNDQTVKLWGTGSATREFMHVDDLADACIYFMKNYENKNILNVGWGIDISIKDLAEKIKLKTGFKGFIDWDKTKPDGTPKKCMDVTEMQKFSFRPKITLDQGLDEMIKIYESKIN